MNLLDLIGALNDAIESAEFHGVKPQDVKVGLMDEEGQEFTPVAVTAWIRTLKAITINIHS